MMRATKESHYGTHIKRSYFFLSSSSAAFWGIPPDVAGRGTSITPWGFTLGRGQLLWPSSPDPLRSDTDSMPMAAGIKAHRFQSEVEVDLRSVLESETAGF